ncbi:MAG: DUF3027 domain-containing protein [Ornithinimicrobium sp.]
MPRGKTDPTLAAAVDIARDAAQEVADTPVGEHLGAEVVAERVLTHRFVCTSAGYPGWEWSVTVARPPRGRRPTVSEVHLSPGPDALVSPEWLPYVDRLAPGDIGAGDRTPFVDEDPMLVAGFEATGDLDVDQVALFELGLGRPRVLSGEGRDDAAQRWYDGSHGPSADVAKSAPAACSTCGYFVPMAGALRALFGVCANAWSPSDGSVVSLDHGCGAHSEVDVETRPAPSTLDPVLDELAVDLVER